MIQEDDQRLPSELSLYELMLGEGCNRYSDLYEVALLDRLREESARAAFRAEDPADAVIAMIPTHDRLATETVLAGHHLDAGEGGSQLSFVIEAPRAFPHRRYVLSFLCPPPEYFSPIVVAERKAAKKAWHAEEPVFIDSARGLTDGPFSRGVRRHAATGEGRESHSHENWRDADPGRGDYERRIKGYWHLQPAGEYRVRMNFLEDISPMDFHGPNGLIWFYPRADSGAESGFAPPDACDDDPAATVMGVGKGHGQDHGQGRAKGSRGLEPLSGEFLVDEASEALELASVMGERLNGAGVICEPDVSLTEPGGSEFRLYPPWREQEVIASIMFEAERDGPTHSDVFPNETLTHRVMSGLSKAVPDQSTAQRMISSADSFMASYQYVENLKDRLEDGGIPERRKEVLRREIKEMEESIQRTGERIGTSNPEVVGLMASLNIERKALYEALEHVHYCSGILDAGLKRNMESRMRDLEELRSGQRRYYG